MIFVTVGTSDFDQLVKKIDELALTLQDQVVVQIGHGKYIPRNCEYFRFTPSLDPYYNKADIIVAQGGLGTTMEVLRKGKKLISVENTTCIDSHQTDILDVLSAEGHLIWCRDLEDLSSLLERLPDINLKPYASTPCEIADIIRDFITPQSRRAGGKHRLRKWIRVGVAFVTYYTGLACLFERMGGQRVRILMYHSVADTPSYLHSVSPAAFEEQMRLLATRYNVISLDRLVERFSGEGTLPDNPVVITFDDGWEDNYTTAYPILQKYNLPATLFLVPDWIEARGGRPAEREYVTWDQVREMSRNGISIGAHTLSHRSLKRLSPEEIRRELVESKARLEEKLGQPVEFFAYPYGAIRDINTEIARLVAASGYDCAVTTLSGSNRPGQNLYTLHRTEVEAVDGMWTFRKMMSGALDGWIVFQWLRWVSQVVRGTS
ncbi:MAG: hypothetical protein DRJ03_21120 [Chloroflexi bacterium]|nr:MAG: hypothetical protein DRJ03_21120 [Chloroflexota bacterium]